MKPDAYRLILGNYPLSVTVPSRFRDLDTLGHINNVAIGSFYEEGRARLNRECFPIEMRKRHKMRMLIADCTSPICKKPIIPATSSSAPASAMSAAPATASTWRCSRTASA